MLQVLSKRLPRTLPLIRLQQPRRSYHARQHVAPQAGVPFGLTVLGNGLEHPASAHIKYLRHSMVFDVGEGINGQLEHSHAKMTEINKIFITHLHGDHCFGLPGLLARLNIAHSVSMKSKNGKQTRKHRIEIYGPKGLRALVRTFTKLCFNGLSFSFDVIELRTEGVKERVSGGINLPPTAKGEWENIYEDKLLTISAAMVRHSVFCVGYVVTEKPGAGKVKKVKELKDILENPENVEYLVKNGHIRRGKSPLSMFETLKSGVPIQLATHKLLPEDWLEDRGPGRKVVVLGDTCDPSGIARLGANADVLFHEATLCEFPKEFEHLEKGRFSESTATTEAVKYMHSTPEMAGAFAKAMNCRHVLLTHFSNRLCRFEGGSEEVETVLEHIRDLAVSTHHENGKVTIAKGLDYVRFFPSFMCDQTNALREGMPDIDPATAYERTKQAAEQFRENSVKSQENFLLESSGSSGA